MIQMLVILVIVFVVSALIVYYITIRNRERIKLIEKGLNPDEGFSIREYRRQTNLQNGILLISLGTGLFTGHLLAINIEELDNFITYLTMLLIHGGIGFVFSYFIIKNRDQK